MAKFLYRTGRFCAAHALVVLLAWIVLAVGLTGLKAQFGGLTSNDQSLPGTQSQQASDLPFQVPKSSKVIEVRYRNTVFPGTTAQWNIHGKRQVWPTR